MLQSEFDAVSLRNSVQKEPNWPSAHRTNQQILRTVIIEITSDYGTRVGIQICSRCKRRIDEFFAARIDEDTVLFVSAEIFSKSR